jgi:hypothetical protein
MPTCTQCGTRVQSGRLCSVCELSNRYGEELVLDGGRRIVGQRESVTPSVECGECAASYNGSGAARGCCGGGD